jgi:phage terminase large subunit-like protein
VTEALARWRSSPTEFIETVLHDPETGSPFKLLPAEREFLAHSFKLDADGRLLYAEQVYSCPKKSGKTAFGALHLLTTILLFAGKFGEGYAVANDLEQAISRVFQAAKRIVECSPLLKREAKITADKITFPAFDNAALCAIASDYAGAAGANPNETVVDESWAISSERGYRLFDEMIPPPTRKIACRLTVTYAGFSGESVLLEALYKRGMAQPEVGPSLRAGDGILMFWSHEPVAPWQDQKWISQMRRDLRPNQYLRMIENRWVTSEAAFISMESWDRCVNPALGHAPTNSWLQVYVGVDASVKHDSTAIVGVTYDAKSRQVRLAFHRVFQPTPEEPIDFGAIEAALVDLSKRFRLRKVLYDPYQMAASAQRLVKLGLPLEELPQTSANLTAMSQNLYELIQSQSLVCYPDAAMRLAVSRAVAVETPRGWRISKEKASHKIDVVVALAMACHAAVQSQSESLFVGFGAGAHNWIDGLDLDADERGSGGQSYADHRRGEEGVNFPQWYLEALKRG